MHSYIICFLSELFTLATLKYADRIVNCSCRAALVYLIVESLYLLTFYLFSPPSHLDCYLCDCIVICELLRTSGSSMRAGVKSLCLWSWDPVPRAGSAFLPCQEPEPPVTLLAEPFRVWLLSLPGVHSPLTGTCCSPVISLAPVFHLGYDTFLDPPQCLPPPGLL